MDEKTGKCKNDYKDSRASSRWKKDYGLFKIRELLFNVENLLFWELVLGIEREEDLGLYPTFSRKWMGILNLFYSFKLMWGFLRNEIAANDYRITKRYYPELRELISFKRLLPPAEIKELRKLYSNPP